MTSRVLTWRASESRAPRPFDVGAVNVHVKVFAAGVYPAARPWYGTPTENQALLDAIERGTWEDIEIEVDFESVFEFPMAGRPESARQALIDRRKLDIALYARVLGDALGRRTERTRSCTFSGHWIDTHVAVMGVVNGMAETRKNASSLGTTKFTFRFPDDGPYRKLTNWEDFSMAFSDICGCIGASGVDLTHDLAIDDQTTDGAGCLIMTHGLVSLLKVGSIRSLTHEVAAPVPGRRGIASASYTQQVWSALSEDRGPAHLTLRRIPHLGGDRVDFLRRMRDRADLQSLTLLDWRRFDADEAIAFLRMLDGKQALETLVLHASDLQSEAPLLMPDTQDFVARMQAEPLGAVSLQSLDLDGWSVGAATVVHLAEALSGGHFLHLNALALRAVQFRDGTMGTFLRALARCRTLQTFLVEHTYMAVADIAEALIEFLEAPDSDLRHFTLNNCAISLAQRDDILRAALLVHSMERIRILDTNGDLTTLQETLIENALGDSTRLVEVDVRDQTSDPFQTSSSPHLELETDLATNIYLHSSLQNSSQR